MCAALLATTMSACAPGPAPTPAPTPAFATEEEAFAAAEEVYRAYNDALNNVDPANPESFESALDLSSGEVRAADRERFSLMQAEGHQISGSARVLSFQGLNARPPFDSVSAQVCLDVREVSIVDANGNSLVSPDRPDAYSIVVTLRQRDRHLRVNGIELSEDETCFAE